jgi:hypothetical protein
LFHSLRASLESDLAQSFPLATVAKWLGNTPSVALQHYVDPTDVAFQRAKTWTPPEIEPSEHAPYSAKQSAVKAQNPAQQAEATESEEQKTLTQTLVEFQVTPSFAAPFQIVQNCIMGDTGLEPPQKNPGFSGIFENHSAKYSALKDGGVAIPPELGEILEVWDSLPEELKEAFRRFVNGQHGDR